jgi:hypothetical protein
VHLWDVPVELQSCVPVLRLQLVTPAVGFRAYRLLVLLEETFHHWRALLTMGVCPVCPSCPCSL